MYHCGLSTPNRCDIFWSCWCLVCLKLSVSEIIRGEHKMCRSRHPHLKQQSQHLKIRFLINIPKHPVLNHIEISPVTCASSALFSGRGNSFCRDFSSVYYGSCLQIFMYSNHMRILLITRCCLTDLWCQQCQYNDSWNNNESTLQIAHVYIFIYCCKRDMDFIRCSSVVR